MRITRHQLLRGSLILVFIGLLLFFFRIGLRILYTESSGLIIFGWMFVGLGIICFLIATFLLDVFFNKKFPQTYEEKLTKLGEFKRPGRPGSHFGDIVEYSVILLPAVALWIGLSWLVNATGRLVLWPITIVFTVWFVWFLRDSVQAVIIMSAVVLPLTYYHLIEGSELAVTSMISLVTGTFLVASKLKGRNILWSHKRLSGEFWNQISAFWSVHERLQQILYSKKEVSQYQSMVIFLVFLLFIIAPIVARLMPSSYQYDMSEFVNLTTKYKEYLPYFAFVMYCMIGITPLTGFFFDPLISKHPNIFIMIFRLFLFVSGVILLILPFVTVSMVLASLIVLIGNTAMGLDFAIVIGFFVFPAWSTTLFSLIAALLYLYLPIEYVRRMNSARRGEIHND